MKKIAGLQQYPFNIFFIVLAFSCLQAKAQNIAAYSDSLNRLNINFTKLGSLPAHEREDTARSIYARYRKADSASAMHKLDELGVFAKQLGDKALECYVFDLRADYFSVNRGFNELSTAYYQKAIDLAVSYDLTVETGVHLHHKGVYYSTFKHNADACLCFLQAQEKFKEAGFDKVYNIAGYLSQVADFYYALGDYEVAKKYLVSALEYNITWTRMRINMTNTIGMIYRSNKQYPQALNYFNAAQTLAVNDKDSVWIGIARGNIGSVYFIQGRNDEALPYIENDYRESLKYKESQNAVIALLRIVKIDVEKNNLVNARHNLDTAELILKNWRDYLNVAITIYELNAQLYAKMGQPGRALAYRELYDQAKDSVARRDNISAVDRVTLKWETDKRQEQMDKLKATNEIEALKRNGVIAVLVLLIIIFGQMYYRRLLKARKNQELMALEKRRTDDELKSATQALQLFTDNLKQKNDMIETFKEEIDRLNVRTAGIEDEEHIEKLMQAHIMTDDSWNEFKKLFMKVHSGFLSAIRTNYPGLSETDMRMLALLKLRLNKREMANMLGITTGGIKKGKQRLRKKMGLPEEAEIEEVIEHF